MEPTSYNNAVKVTISVSTDKSTEGLPIFAKWGIKIGTVLMGTLIILMGVLTTITVLVRCIIAGIILM